MAGFLEDLERLGEEHGELYDTDVRERLWTVVESALIEQRRGYEIPAELGMFTPEANARLAAVLRENVARLRSVFATFQLETPRQRRASFTNPALHTESGRTVDEFFGSP